MTHHNHNTFLASYSIMHFNGILAIDRRSVSVLLKNYESNETNNIALSYNAFHEYVNLPYLVEVLCIVK